MKILGGEGGNRLHRVLRSERGLTYGASADLNALKDAGDIVAETDTRSEKTAEALRLIVEEIVRLQRQRVQQRELSDAQEYLTGSFPLTVETPSAIALQVLNAVFYGLDLNELQTYRERVNTITVEDIQRVAQLYLHPDKLSIVLVGDASVFARTWPGVGFDQVERIPIARAGSCRRRISGAIPRRGRDGSSLLCSGRPPPRRAPGEDERARALIAGRSRPRAAGTCCGRSRPFGRSPSRRSSRTASTRICRAPRRFDIRRRSGSTR